MIHGTEQEDSILLVSRLAKQILVLGTMASLMACAAPTVRDAPCYDGWTRDQSGRSIVWQPSTEELSAIQSLLPDDQQLQCIHRMPSGRLVVLSTGPQWVHSLELLFSEDHYEVLDRGWVVGHD